MVAVLVFTKEKINYGALDVIISAEIIIHQVLAVHYVGLDAGFQYILLDLGVPVIYYSLKKIFTVITIVKAVLGLIIFLICDYLYKYRLTPVYQVVDKKVLAVSNYLCILSLFVSIAKGTIESYTKYKVKLEKEYGFHKKAIEKQMAMQQNVVQTIADIVEARDETTGQHTERTKKEKMDKETALAIMREGRGTQFDPDVFDCFMEYIETQG